MQPWAIGVFTSVDAGLGVRLDVAKELGVPTVQIHAPHKETRTAAAGTVSDYRFSGFVGWSYGAHRP